MSKSAGHSYILITWIIFITCVKGLVDEGDVKCERLRGCERKDEDTPNTIYFGLMLSFPDPQHRDSFIGAFDDGHDIAPAAYLAIEHINNRSDLLSDYQVKLVRVDGGCNVTERTVIGINELTCSCKPMVGIIGPSCGTSSMVVSQIAGSESFSLVTIHYGQRSILGNRSSFPFAFGILGSHELYIDAIVELVRQNCWKRIAILFSEDDIDIARSIEIRQRVKELKEFEISFVSAIYDNYIPLQEIKNTFTRVILVLGTPGITLRTVCLAFHKQMLFPNYQWIFVERTYSDFHNISFAFNDFVFKCSDSDIMFAINGSIDLLFDAAGEGDVQSVTDFGVTFQQYKQGYRMHIEEYMTEFNVSSNEVDWAKGFYDATWSLAFALNDSLKELNTSLTHIRTGSNILAKSIARHMVRLQFQGVSGRVNFDHETGFNQEVIVNIYQYRLNTTGTIIGIYTHNNFTLLPEANPSFISALFKNRFVHVHITVAAILISLTILILPLAFPLQIVNIVYRTYKPIKASSPCLNHLIFVGCYLIAFSTVLYLLAETYKHISLTVRQHLYNVIPLFLTTGVSLIIGTIFVKTWRLHRIYTHSKKFSSANVSFLNNKLLGSLVIILACLDILVCILWISLDKLKINETKKVQHFEGDEFPVVVIYDTFSSEYMLYWLVLLLAPKVTLTLCSFFLAFLTRFNMKEFTTKNVVVLVYLLSILSVFMIPSYVLISAIGVDITIRVTILCLFLDFMVFICILFSFIPPLYALMKAKKMCHITMCKSL